MGNRVHYVIAKDPKGAISDIRGLFPDSKVDKKVKLSRYGSVVVGHNHIVATPITYRPSIKPISERNESVKLRMEVMQYIKDTIASTLRPLTIVFDGKKRITIKGVIGVKSSSTGITDMRLVLVGNREIPVAIHREIGVYRHKIQARNVHDRAYAALEKAAEDGMLDATMEDDRMTLHHAVVMKAPTPAINGLIFSDIKGGFGIVGDLTDNDFRYRGKDNTLTVKCYRVFKSSSDLVGGSTPYLLINNSSDQNLGELKGLQVDLVPRRGLPRDYTIINI